ncbi:hypothetical protein [Edaphobacter aggregans]|uniref:hypothetical protein n=1 Tax=Edaphobacter aggregans TaxID=570835 RepID=UPI0012FBA804|nr:hypothetical protein [Edaphobacter aggregans]
MTLDEKSAPRGSDLFAGDWRPSRDYAWITGKPETIPKCLKSSGFRQVQFPKREVPVLREVRHPVGIVSQRNQFRLATIRPSRPLRFAETEFKQLN